MQLTPEQLLPPGLRDYYDRVQKRVVRRVIETSPVLTIDAKVWKATASMN